MTHRTIAELEAGLERIRQSPKDEGILELIVRRPLVGERESLDQGFLDVADGLIGDTWRARASSRSRDGKAHPDMQLNIINSRVIALIAGDRARWQLAGDQLFVDMDLSTANLPAWTEIAIGSAVVQVTDQPHTGCGKFTTRFGVDAAAFVNSTLGRELCLRGINAKVIQPGSVRVGDRLRKLS